MTRPMLNARRRKREISQSCGPIMDQVHTNHEFPTRSGVEGTRGGERINLKPSERN
eukprot:jgi/Psemu1/304319/fgenesh1_kg.146_\